MKQIPLYSLVIFPLPEQIDLVQSYKQLLKSRIGWFGSANAAAHITIIQFGNDMELQLYIEKTREFCKSILSQNLTFNSWGKFENAGTLFIAPDTPSKSYVNNLIIDLHKYLGFKINPVQANAHMSIGRRLFDGKLELAEKVFQNFKPDLTFNCDALHIRKFDGRQYSEIIEKISFSIV